MDGVEVVLYVCFFFMVCEEIVVFEEVDEVELCGDAFAGFAVDDADAFFVCDPVFGVCVFVFHP